MKKIVLKSPLFTGWTDQYVRLPLDKVEPLDLKIDGVPSPFQFTGDGAEILVRLGFSEDQIRTLEFGPAADGSSATDLSRKDIPLGKTALVGVPGRELRVRASAPFFGFADFAMSSRIHCETAFEGAALARINDGPLFTDYELQYRFAENRRYLLKFRCYKQDPYVEVGETFSLRMNAELVWTVNPEKKFTHIISRDSFEGETQPTVEPLGEEHPRDVLCRLQMPPLSDYFIPNNRGWFAFFDSRDEAAGMLGILGLYGAEWEEPVANMPEIFDRKGTVEWHASLASGRRFWLLYSGPVEKGYRCQVSGASEDKLKPETRNLKPSSDTRFVFHRLHAEFNALRLDEHFDLSGDGIFDASCASSPGIFAAGDFHAAALERLKVYPCLARNLHDPDQWMKKNGLMHNASLRYLLEPTNENAASLYGFLDSRFEKWVRQFQGYRSGQHDYSKSVIGFSRYLRGMLMAYELLRRDGAMSDGQVRRMNSYFAFAARRILDEGRWPHSRTWKHPDHPESSRDFYAYGGEHRPDRLVWTNCLPNFQSDPLCGLAHISAMFRDHPDAKFWLRFALDDIDRQLDAYCGKSGAWEESINYALYTFSYFIITFKPVKERWGIDYFNDERVRRFAGWLCRFFGPFDKRFNAYTWPAIGNSVLPQNQGEYLLCYASEMAEGDPLREESLAVWEKTAPLCRPSEHYPLVMAAMAPLKMPDARCQVPGKARSNLKPETRNLKPLSSEVMDEVGVAMRHRHTEADESYLFQKIGFAKDHYEADETAFNWYAKGTPFCMEYGTYTSEASVGGAHNVVEIPDEDALRRGYLAAQLLTDAVDYTHCEVPVTLKLLWGKVRSFAEVENKDGKIDRRKTPYFYIGDKNPVGPKAWKVRKMLFIKPDYIVLFDRVYGQVPHRYNLHFTGTDIRREGQRITGKGRFDLDLLAFVQHPAEFDMELGELIPNVHSGCDQDRRNHSQNYLRIYNTRDGIYRTLVFANERGRDVRLQSIGSSGIKIVTPEYTDYVFMHDDLVDEVAGDIRFKGRVGMMRRRADGSVMALVPDGDLIAAFGTALEGRGPWSFNLDGSGRIVTHGGPPRGIGKTPATT